MFSAYHLGLLQTLKSDLPIPGIGGGSMDELTHAGARAGMLAFGWFVLQPWLSHLVQDISGNPRASVRPAGPFMPLDIARQLQRHEMTYPQAAMRLFTPSPLLQTAASFISGYDSFTGRALVDPLASDAEALQELAGGTLTAALGPIRTAGQIQKKGLAPAVVQPFARIGVKMLPGEADFLMKEKDMVASAVKHMRGAMDKGDWQSADRVYQHARQMLIQRAYVMLVEEREHGIIPAIADNYLQMQAEDIVNSLKLPVPEKVHLYAPSDTPDLPPWFSMVYGRKTK
jgi:hypothetical protein